MKILKIKKNKLTFENGIEFSLSKNIITEYQLKENQELDEKTYMFLAKTSALSYSYWLLARKDYSRGELKNKLYTKYKNKTLILKITEKLSEMSYINDYEFTKSYIESHKNWGRKKLEFYLSIKEVNKNIIKEVLDENIDEEEEKIKKLLDKMKNKDERKKIESLMRKGFQYSLIKKIISKI